MQISTKGRYALRLMLDLAVHNTGELDKIKILPQRSYFREVSGADYFVLEEGWICEESERSAGRIYAGQGSKNLYGRVILRLTEGSMKPVACLEDEPNQCDRAGECVTLRLWKMLDEAIEGVLDKVTLQDLKDWYEQMGNDYVI